MDSIPSQSKMAEPRLATAGECLQTLADAAFQQRALVALLERIGEAEYQVRNAGVRAQTREEDATAALRRLAHADPGQVRPVSHDVALQVAQAQQVVSALEAEATALVQRAEVEGGAL